MAARTNAMRKLPSTTQRELLGSTLIMNEAASSHPSKLFVDCHVAPSPP